MLRYSLREKIEFIYIYIYFFYAISVRTLRTFEYSTDGPFITPGIHSSGNRMAKTRKLEFQDSSSFAQNVESDAQRLPYSTIIH